MTNEIVPVGANQHLTPVSELQQMAVAVAKSRLFGVQTADQALALMLLAQAEGMHPAAAMRDYDVINGRPALKSGAMLARFQSSGGVVEWLDMSDQRCAANFSHPQLCPKPVLIDWDMQRADKAGLKKNMYFKYPRQMLRARVISEGVRACLPGVLQGLYTPEEAIEFEPVQHPEPAQTAPSPEPQPEPQPKIQAAEMPAKTLEFVITKVEERPDNNLTLAQTDDSILFISGETPLRAGERITATVDDIGEQRGWRRYRVQSWQYVTDCPPIIPAGGEDA